ncbi:DUF1836 domain-containing protein [Pseudoflavonifractor phocaeensis]|uniref:DUF1836 domain-containing protein n=1 Tax=Pseudoflavonifractor phocaeensis TaxID=1870988 RepID=UPI00195AE7E9|nr:DUF1836 domain-containing protein [Pseudoflavonifractor phocaeensis]MBM6939259.1 DUF1836 domain-containing protein [Pseudoflavonifractor phocaeensis]
MEELEELKERMAQDRPVEWASFPDLGLYMDQIISYMPRQLIHYGEGELLTSAMVNNYIKDGLLPRAEGKRYSRTHLAYLTAICVLKQVLSVREVKDLLAVGESRKGSAEALYTYFCKQLDGVLRETSDFLPQDGTEEDLPRLALALALRSYADRLACQRVLDIMAEHGMPAEPANGKRKKER